jgi:MFS transporter, Spinster family, sphingosine-1-phosphate transporter
VGFDGRRERRRQTMSTASSPVSHHPSASRTAWLVVALLVPVALLNYLDRQLLAAMKVSVMRDVPSIGSEANWGMLPAVFKWVYAALSPFAGYMADRLGYRRVIGTSLAVWSVVTWATGHCVTFPQLVTTRALMGISEAFYIPAALALIANFHSDATRSRAVGVHQAGIYCGVIIGSFSGYAADHPSIGWRGAFDLCGLAGLIYAVPLLLLLREPPRTAQKEERTGLLEAAGELFTSRSFLCLVGIFTLVAIPAWVVRDWMPAILQQKFDISQGRAGVSATLYWQLAAIVFAFFGGWLADRWMRHTPRARTYVSAIGIACLAPALFGIGYAPTLTVAVAFLILFGAGWGFFDTNNMPILSQIARPGLRATGYGLMNLVSISAGGFADWTFGVLRDREVPLAAIFSVFSGLALVSIVLVLCIRPRQVD